MVIFSLCLYSSKIMVLWSFYFSLVEYYDSWLTKPVNMELFKIMTLQILLKIMKEEGLLGEARKQWKCDYLLELHM